MRFREKRLLSLCGEGAKSNSFVVWLDLYLWYPYKVNSIDVMVYANSREYKRNLAVKKIKIADEAWYVACMDSALRKNQIGIPILCNELNPKNEIHSISYTFKITYQIGEMTYYQYVHKTTAVCFKNEQKGDYLIEDYITPIPAITDWKIMDKFKKILGDNQTIVAANINFRPKKEINLNIVKNENKMSKNNIIDDISAINIDKTVNNIAGPTKAISISLYRNKDIRYISDAASIRT